MIGERLRAERIRLELSQPALGEIAGAAKRTVIDWEKGASSPTSAQLAQLARVGVDPMYVLTGVRSVAQVGMSQADIDAFNRLVSVFWNLSDESRETAQHLLSALSLKDVRAGTARGVRMPKAKSGAEVSDVEPTAAAPLVSVAGKNAGVIQSTTGSISNTGPLIVRKGRSK